MDRKIYWNPEAHYYFQLIDSFKDNYYSGSMSRRYHLRVYVPGEHDGDGEAAACFIAEDRRGNSHTIINESVEVTDTVELAKLLLMGFFP
jgi:hypothetical protein